MKKIEAIIRPEKFDDVQKAMEQVGYTGLMVTEIQGHGAQKGIIQQWRGGRIQGLPDQQDEAGDRLQGYRGAEARGCDHSCGPDRGGRRRKDIRLHNRPGNPHQKRETGEKAL